MRTALVAAGLALVVSVAVLCPQAHAQPGAVVINEVLFNPTGPDSLAEWVELGNPSPMAPVSLAGWVLTNVMRTQVFPLPPVILPPQAFLVVRFQVGPDDFDFTDGEGLYSTDTSAPVFNNELDAVALYWSVPMGPPTVADFVAWSATGIQPAGPSMVDAIASGQWPPGSFVDVSWGGPAFVAPWTEGPGETIGRDGLSSDSNSPADWTDHGGVEALAETEGAKNTGPYFSGPDLIYVAQQSVNQFLWEFALNTKGASHTLVSLSESEFSVQVTATHTFQVTSRVDGTDTELTGEIYCEWRRFPGSEWRLDMSGQLYSSRGMEELQFTAALVDSGVLVGTKVGTSRSASLFYTTPMGFPVSLDLEYAQRWTWTDPTRIFLLDTRSMTDSRGVSLTRTTQRIQWFPNDAVEEINLGATTIFTQPPSAPTEHFQEHCTKTMRASGAANGTLDLCTLETDGRSISLLAPSSFQWTVVNPDSLEFHQAITIGSPELGYDNGTVDATYGAIIDPTTGELLVRGGVDVLFGSQPPWELSFYVDGWSWKRFSRVLSAGGWAMLCAGGVLIGAPTVVGGVAAAGLCAAGGLIEDDWIQENCPPGKVAPRLRQDIPPPLIAFPRLVCLPSGVPDPALPTALSLSPGRPNPFGGETSFVYEMPRPGRVELIVCDAGGRLVRTLVDLVQPGGRYEAAWDGRDDRGTRVSSGAYFVRLLTPSGTSRVMVVRAAGE